jgi:hypothetical protein
MSTSASDDRAPTEGAVPPGEEAGDTEAVLRELATSIALLPQTPPPDGEQRPEGAIALPVIEQEGRQYIPVFTSEDALQAAGADVATAIRIPIAQLAANWPSDDLWLAVNPASQEGLALPPDLVKALPVFAQGGQDQSGGEAGEGGGETQPG